MVCRVCLRIPPVYGDRCRRRRRHAGRVAGAQACVEGAIQPSPADDATGGIAADKAADIQQAAAVERFYTEVTAHDHSDATAGADVIVLTGPADQPTSSGPRKPVCIGSAPSAFHAALRAIVTVELRCSASEVSLAVLGIPPQHVVVPWSETTVREVAISQLLDPLRLARLQRKVPLVWPP